MTLVTVRLLTLVLLSNSHALVCAVIGGGNRGERGPWPPLNLRPLHRNVIFAIENHFGLSKWPLLLLVASSSSVCSQLTLLILFTDHHPS